jgi:hypothetical protein
VYVVKPFLAQILLSDPFVVDVLEYTALSEMSIRRQASRDGRVRGEVERGRPE